MQAEIKRRASFFIDGKFNCWKWMGFRLFQLENIVFLLFMRFFYSILVFGACVDDLISIKL